MSARNFGGVEVVDRAIHETADGRKLLVIHGDKFDVVVRHAAWLAHLGAGAYNAVLAVNTGFNRIRRRLGLPYWSLSAWTKLKVKNAVNFIGAFEEALANEARRVGADGVVCGHIHHAQIDDDGRLPLPQCRRLGGKLHRDRRAPRRRARDHPLDRAARAARRRPMRTTTSELAEVAA